MQQQDGLLFVRDCNSAHVQRPNNCCQVFSLQQQIQHKVSFVQQHLWKGKDRIPLAIVGHSIGRTPLHTYCMTFRCLCDITSNKSAHTPAGAYMALKATKELQSTQQAGETAPIAKVSLVNTVLAVLAVCSCHPEEQLLP